MYENERKSLSRSLDAVQVVEVIRTEMQIGTGTPDDPYRILTRYWNFDGKLLAEKEGSD